MAKRVRTEDAASVYETRYGRSWRGDASLGIVLAIAAEMRERLTRGVVSIGREVSEGRAVSRPEPLPAWALRELEAYHPKARALLNGSGPAFDLVVNPEWLRIVERLSSADAANLTDAERVVLTASALPGAEAAFARTNRKRRHDEVSYMLFVGVRLTLAWKGRAEPTASQLALIAAAAGIDSLDEGLTKASRTWDHRLRRWRSKMDETPWRPMIAALPTGALQDALLPG